MLQTKITSKLGTFSLVKLILILIALGVIATVAVVPFFGEGAPSWRTEIADKAVEGPYEPLPMVVDQLGEPQDEEVVEYTGIIKQPTAILLDDALKDASVSDMSSTRIFNFSTKAGTAGFTDVPAGAWYKKYAKRLIGKKAIAGYPDGEFKPNRSVTRAEFAKMVCLALGWDLVTPEAASFSDVNPDSWAYGYIETAKTHGVINGYVNGEFRPNNGITRADVAKIIAEALDLTAGERSFEDVDESFWAKPFIDACYTAGLIGGYADEKFRPFDTTTRAEAAKIVAEIVNK